MIRASASFVLAAFAAATLPRPAVATAPRPTLMCRVFDAAERRLQGQHQRMVESHPSCAVCNRWPATVAFASMAFTPDMADEREKAVPCAACGHTVSYRSGPPENVPPAPPAAPRAPAERPRELVS